MKNLGHKVVEGFINGDEESFNQVFDVFSRSIWSFFYQNTRSKEITEELVNNTFMRLWKYRSNIDPEKGIKNYLNKIARSIFYNWLEQVSRDEKMKERYSSDCKHNEQNLQECNDLDTSIDLKLLIDHVHTLLPEKRRKVFLLSRFGGMSYAEIASHLSIGKETVKDHLSKASQTLSILNKTGDYI
jgi:RNA polymerase sigma-70 factor (ECF subfamily)